MTDVSKRVLVTSCVSYTVACVHMAVNPPWWAGPLFGFPLGVFLLWLWRKYP